MDVFPQIPLPRDARNLMDRLLCDVDDRLGSNGVQELKVGLHGVLNMLCNFHAWSIGRTPGRHACLSPLVDAGSSQSVQRLLGCQNQDYV